MRPSAATSRMPKSRASRRGTGMAATVAVGVRVLVVGEHLPHVHLVDVVAAEDADELRPLVVDDVLALPHRVGRAAVPRLARALLRGDGLDELVEHRREAPVARDVLLERRALVLREHLDAREPRVDEVREDDVDDAIATAEGHRRLRAVERERVEALALAAGEDHHEHLRRVEVELPPVHRENVDASAGPPSCEGTEADGVQLAGRSPRRRMRLTADEFQYEAVARAAALAGLARGVVPVSCVGRVTEEVAARDVVEAGTLDVADDEELVDAVGRLDVFRPAALGRAVVDDDVLAAVA